MNGSVDNNKNNIVVSNSTNNKHIKVNNSTSNKVTLTILSYNNNKVLQKNEVLVLKNDLNYNINGSTNNSKNNIKVLQTTKQCGINNRVFGPKDDVLRLEDGILGKN